MRVARLRSLTKKAVHNIEKAEKDERGCLRLEIATPVKIGEKIHWMNGLIYLDDHAGRLKKVI